MITRAQFQETFNKAVANEENWKNGKINWNFVDADCFPEIGNQTKLDQYYDWFNLAADAYFLETI